MDKLRKIRQYHWKERPNIGKIAEFENDTSYASEDIAPQSCENLQVCLYGRGKVGWGPSLPPPPPPPPHTHHTNVCKISRLWEAVSSLVFNKWLSNLANFTNRKALFSVVSMDISHTCPCQKLKKNSEKVYWKSIEKLLSGKNLSLIYQIPKKYFLKLTTFFQLF